LIVANLILRRVCKVYISPFSAMLGATSFKVPEKC
jgi:hypothetical protein